LQQKCDFGRYCSRHALAEDTAAGMEFCKMFLKYAGGVNAVAGMQLKKLL
jgi:hypothetical protein